MNLTDRYGFKGEVYTGQGLGQMGGGILQSLDAVTWKAIRSTGGWVEGYVYLTPNLHNHTGFIIDDPNNKDITGIPNTLFGRTLNRVFFNTLLWDLGGRRRSSASGWSLRYVKRSTRIQTPRGGYPTVDSVSIPSSSGCSREQRASVGVKFFEEFANSEAYEGYSFQLSGTVSF